MTAAPHHVRCLPAYCSHNMFLSHSPSKTMLSRAKPCHASVFTGLSAQLQQQCSGLRWFLLAVQPASVHLHPHSVDSRRRLMVLRTVTAEPVFRVYAPPAWTFLQGLHFQMPTAWRLTANLPQKLQKYLLC